MGEPDDSSLSVWCYCRVADDAAMYTLWLYQAPCSRSSCGYKQPVQCVDCPLPERHPSNDQRASSLRLYYGHGGLQFYFSLWWVRQFRSQPGVSQYWCCFQLLYEEVSTSRRRDVGSWSDDQR